MFRCTACGSTEFRLLLRPGGSAAAVTISLNEHDDVIIEAGERRFIADLMFINQFGACHQCNATKQWEYYFPKA